MRKRLKALLLAIAIALTSLSIPAGAVDGITWAGYKNTSSYTAGTPQEVGAGKGHGWKIGVTPYKLKTPYVVKGSKLAKATNFKTAALAELENLKKAVQDSMQYYLPYNTGIWFCESQESGMGTKNEVITDDPITANLNGSSIKWLGDIVATWNITKLKTLVPEGTVTWYEGLVKNAYKAGKLNTVDDCISFTKALGTDDRRKFKAMLAGILANSDGRNVTSALNSLFNRPTSDDLGPTLYVVSVLMLAYATGTDAGLVRQSLKDIESALYSTKDTTIRYVPVIVLEELNSWVVDGGTCSAFFTFAEAAAYASGVDLSPMYGKGSTGIISKASVDAKVDKEFTDATAAKYIKNANSNTYIRLLNNVLLSRTPNYPNGAKYPYTDKDGNFPRDKINPISNGSVYGSAVNTVGSGNVGYVCVSGSGPQGFRGIITGQLLGSGNGKLYTTHDSEFCKGAIGTVYFVGAPLLNSEGIPSSANYKVHLASVWNKKNPSKKLYEATPNVELGIDSYYAVSINVDNVSLKVGNKKVKTLDEYVDAVWPGSCTIDYDLQYSTLWPAPKENAKSHITTLDKIEDTQKLSDSYWWKTVKDSEIMGLAAGTKVSPGRNGKVTVTVTTKKAMKAILEGKIKLYYYSTKFRNNVLGEGEDKFTAAVATVTIHGMKGLTTKDPKTNKDAGGRSNYSYLEVKTPVGGGSEDDPDDPPPGGDPNKDEATLKFKVEEPRTWAFMAPEGETVYTFAEGDVDYTVNFSLPRQYASELSAKLKNYKYKDKVNIELTAKVDYGDVPSTVKWAQHTTTLNSSTDKGMNDCDVQFAKSIVESVNNDGSPIKFTIASEEGLKRLSEMIDTDYAIPIDSAIQVGSKSEIGFSWEYKYTLKVQYNNGTADLFNGKVKGAPASTDFCVTIGNIGAEPLHMEYKVIASPKGKAVKTDGKAEDATIILKDIGEKADVKIEFDGEVDSIIRYRQLMNIAKSGTITCKIARWPSNEKENLNALTDVGITSFNWEGLGGLTQTSGSYSWTSTSNIKAAMASFLPGNYIKFVDVLEAEPGKAQLNIINDHKFAYTYYFEIDMEIETQDGSKVVVTFDGKPDRDDASWHGKERFRWNTDNTSKAFAELKETREGKYYSEEWEAMSGTPTTENLYYAVGGDEFVVQSSYSVTSNGMAVRTLTYNLPDVIYCEKNNVATHFGGAGEEHLCNVATAPGDPSPCMGNSACDSGNRCSHALSTQQIITCQCAPCPGHCTGHGTHTVANPDGNGTHEEANPCPNGGIDYYHDGPCIHGDNFSQDLTAYCSHTACDAAGLGAKNGATVLNVIPGPCKLGCCDHTKTQSGCSGERTVSSVPVKTQVWGNLADCNIWRKQSHGGTTHYCCNEHCGTQHNTCNPHTMQYKATWRIKSSGIRYMKIDDLKIWQLTEARVVSEDLGTLTGHYDEVVQFSDESAIPQAYWYIGQKNSFPSDATVQAAARRIYYYWHPESNDTVDMREASEGHGNYAGDGCMRYYVLDVCGADPSHGKQLKTSDNCTKWSELTYDVIDKEYFQKIRDNWVYNKQMPLTDNKTNNRFGFIVMSDYAIFAGSQGKDTPAYYYSYLARYGNQLLDTPDHEINCAAGFDGNIYNLAKLDKNAHKLGEQLRDTNMMSEYSVYIDDPCISKLATINGMDRSKNTYQWFNKIWPSDDVVTYGSPGLPTIRYQLWMENAACAQYANYTNDNNKSAGWHESGGISNGGYGGNYDAPLAKYNTRGMDGYKGFSVTGTELKKHDTYWLNPSNPSFAKLADYCNNGSYIYASKVNNKTIKKQTDRLELGLWDMDVYDQCENGVYNIPYSHVYYTLICDYGNDPKLHPANTVSWSDDSINGGKGFEQATEYYKGSGVECNSIVIYDPVSAWGNWQDTDDKIAGFSKGTALALGTAMPVDDRIEGEYGPELVYNVEGDGRLIFPLRGPIRQASTDLGLDECKKLAGKGYGTYGQLYDCTRWTKTKSISMNNTFIIDTNGNGLFEDEVIHYPDDLVQLSIYKPDGVTPLEEYRIYFPEVADEMDNCEVTLYVEAINSGGGLNNTEDYWKENKYSEIASDNWRAIQDGLGVRRLGNEDRCWTNTISAKPIDEDTREIARFHSASRKLKADIVGAIGNLTMTDTGDFRYSNFFKKSVENKWVVDNVVHEVDLTKQARIVVDDVDIFKRVPSIAETHMYNTYRNQDYKGVAGSIWNYQGTPRTGDWSEYYNTFPLMPEDNNIKAYRKTAVRVGYDTYLDVETVGNYWENGSIVKVLISYYAYDRYHRTFLPVDVYMQKDGKYELINVFDNGITNGTYNKTSLYNYPTTMNWDEENVRRMYTDKEKEIRQDYETTEQNGVFDMDTGAWVIKPMYPPRGAKTVQGNKNTLALSATSRTFIGNDHVDTRASGFDDEGYTNVGNQHPLSEFNRASQKWYFSIGLPSSAVFVEAGLQPTVENIKKISDNYDMLISAAYIYAIGPTWTLQHDGRTSWGRLMDRLNDIPITDGKEGHKPQGTYAYSLPKKGSDLATITALVPLPPSDAKYPDITNATRVSGVDPYLPELQVTDSPTPSVSIPDKNPSDPFSTKEVPEGNSSTPQIPTSDSTRPSPNVGGVDVTPNPTTNPNGVVYYKTPGGIIVSVIPGGPTPIPTGSIPVPTGTVVPDITPTSGRPNPNTTTYAVYPDGHTEEVIPGTTPTHGYTSIITGTPTINPDSTPLTPVPGSENHYPGEPTPDPTGPQPNPGSDIPWIVPDTPPPNPTGNPNPPIIISTFTIPETSRDDVSIIGTH